MIILRPGPGVKSATALLGKRIEPDAKGHVTVHHSDAEFLRASGWVTVSMQIDEPTSLDLLKVAQANPQPLSKLWR